MPRQAKHSTSQSQATLPLSTGILIQASPVAVPGCQHSVTRPVHPPVLSSVLIKDMVASPAQGNQQEVMSNQPTGCKTHAYISSRKELLDKPYGKVSSRACDAGQHRWAAVCASGHFEEIGGGSSSLPAPAGGRPGTLCRAASRCPTASNLLAQHLPPQLLNLLCHNRLMVQYELPDTYSVQFRYILSAPVRVCAVLW